MSRALLPELPPAATLEGLLRGLAHEPGRVADEPRLELLYRLFFATRNPRLRKALYTRIRRADDHAWTYQRRLAKQLLDIEIGKYSFGCYHLDWTIAPGSRIGAFCSVGLGVSMGRPNHAMEAVTTHPFLQLPTYGFVEEPDWPVFVRDAVPVTVGDDVWFGDRVQVRGGVTIGKGAVIGQGAVVTRDVEPYAIVAGVPARPLRLRFAEEIVERLVRIDWASWPDETIRARAEDFQDVERFVEKYDR